MSYFVDSWENITNKKYTKRLFLAEGPAEVGAIDAALKVLNADPDTCTILCFKGISKLARQSLGIAKLINAHIPIESLKAIALLADAELDLVGRLDAVLACAKSFGFKKCDHNLRTVYRAIEDDRLFRFHLSPDCKTEGRIEDLVLREIEDNDVFECIRMTIECIAKATKQDVDQKAVVQMYISAAQNNSMAGIKNAFGAGVFNIEHAAYTGILELVRDVCYYT